jgi:hypothetical protein
MNSFKHGARMRKKARNIIGGLAMLGISAVPLHAGELPAKAGESIDLGRFHGVVYYTREDDGYRVSQRLRIARPDRLCGSRPRSPIINRQRYRCRACMANPATASRYDAQAAR